MPFIIIMGIILFLLMEHALVFWLVFVPLAIIFSGSMVGWFKTGGLGMSNVAMAVIAVVGMIIALVIVCIP